MPPRLPLLATLATLFTMNAHAQQPPRADGLYAAQFREHANASTVDVAYGSSTAHVLVGHALPSPHWQSLYSDDNDNRTYSYSATYRQRRCESEVVLVVDGTPVAISSTSTGNHECTYDFRITRTQADRLATSSRITREDRIPTGDRITARFTTASHSYARGAPIEVRIELENPASAPSVQREVGCCRFSFRIARDGTHVQDLECGAMACPVGYVPHAAGSTATDTVDLGTWAHLTTPGHYRVECTYETRFARAGIPTFDSRSFSARMWQREFHGVVEFDIR